MTEAPSHHRSEGSVGLQVAQKSENGNALDLLDGAPVTLPSDGSVWKVEGGTVEIFAQSGAGRFFLGLARDGTFVVTMPPAAKAEMIAVVQEKLRLVRVEKANRAEVESWVKTVVSTLNLSEPDVLPAWIDAGDELPTGQWLKARQKNDVIWIASEAMTYFGTRGGQTRGVLPLYGGLSLKLSHEGEILSDAYLVSSETLHSAVTAFNLEILQLLEASRKSADQRALKQATEVSQDTKPSADAGGIISAVAQDLNYEINIDTRASLTSLSDAQDFFRRAGLRVRQIRLLRGWSKQNLGPLMVQRSGDSAIEALVWDAGHYRARDGASVREAGETSFGKHALAVSAPLPARVTGMFSFALYLLPSLQRDAGTALVAGAGAALVGAVTPLVTGWLFAEVVPANMVTVLLAVGLALLVSNFVAASFSVAKSLSLLRIAGRSGLVTAAAVTDKLLRLPPSFFREFTAGDLNQRIAGIDQLRQLVTGMLISATMTLVFSLFYFVTLVIFDAALAAIAFAVVSIHVVATFIARALQRALLKTATEFEGEVAAASFETLSSVRKLRVAAAEERALKRWYDLYATEREARAKGGRISVYFRAFSDAFQTVSLATLFGVAVFLSAEQISAGVFIGFLIAFGAFQGAFTGFCDTLISLFAAQPIAERAKPVFATPAERTERTSDPGRLLGAIDLSGVSFSYPGGQPLLEALDLSIAPGEHVAIVGETGSGKSTILRLLLGFETPQRGAIVYDGKDLSRLDLGLVRAQIGVVMQTSRLFAGSILDNIRGASGADLEACLDAVKAAGLSGDISRLPMGVHTPVTDGAPTLSGGQRQRILIARAIVGNPAIQFLDEATSALDNRTQAVVMQALQQSVATRVVIAHRLSTVRAADRICVLKNGRFAEIGSYDELMAKNGVFFELASRQLLES